MSCAGHSHQGNGYVPIYCGGKGKLRLDLSYKCVPPLTGQTWEHQETWDLLIFILSGSVVYCNHFVPISNRHLIP